MDFSFITDITDYVGSFFGETYDSINEWIKSKEIGLAVLGMPQSGKTLWLDYLRDHERLEEIQTSYEEYEEFAFYTKSNRKITIKSGEDIGGTDFYINDYEDKIKKNNVIMFFFDSKKYTADAEYQRAVNARLALIERKMDKSKLLYIVMTYLDSWDNKEQGLKEIIPVVQKKKFKNFFKGKNLFFINTCSDEDKLKMKNEIFE